MNENIDLTKILKNCPTGFKLYSSVYGKVKFARIDKKHTNPWIDVITENDVYMSFTSEGKLSIKYNGECVLFPSKDQRDWSKFTSPWLKKERFNPKTLQTFDKVLSRNSKNITWSIDYFSHMEDIYKPYQFFCLSDNYTYCIPYNDDTKHLVGTKEEAPDFYKYWED